jgi:hypothetical protein
MRNHTGRLILAPRDPNCAPDRGPLIHALDRAGFLGPALWPDGDAYAAGEAFLCLLAFTGCAVQVEVRPSTEPDRPFCHIRIAGPFAEPTILIGRNTRPPRCPACRAALRAWRDALRDWTAAPAHAEPLPCPACATVSPACTWDWKETGGCARLILSVEEVFPGEATPTDALMQVLEAVARMPWRHFYVQD